MKQLQTISGETLMSKPLQPMNFVVDTLLSQGLHILAGSPKAGKSWLALWLAVTVAKGEAVWKMPVKQGTTLYLCLEDSQLRNLRKEPSEDVFSRISGTTAISGAVDSSFTLINSNHGSGRAKLFCIGRDIEYREISLERNGDNVWELIDDSHEQRERTDSKIIFLLSELLLSQPEFIGTPTELSTRIDLAGTAGITPKKVARQILQSVDALREIGITATTRRSNGKRIIELHSAESVDSSGTPTVGTIDPVGAVTACPPV